MTAAAMTREEWLEKRRGCICATDISAILGLNPYATALTVYLDKTGQLPEREQTEAMQLGTELEPFIAAMYAKRKGVDFAADVMKGEFCVHPQRPRHGATPDYIYQDHELWECKWAGVNAAMNFGREGSDEIPTHYLCQCQWQMHVTGFKRCRLIVLTPYGLKEYDIPRDEEMIRRMAFRADVFIGEYLDARTPPPLSGHAPDTRLIQQQHPEDDGTEIAASYELEELITELGCKVVAQREAELEIERMKNEVRAFMGEHTKLKSDQGYFSWKKSKDRVKTDWESCAKGLLSYAGILLADQPEIHQLLTNEAIRLTDACTTTEPSPRVFRMPWRSEKA